MTVRLLNKDNGGTARDIITEYVESFGNKRQTHELWILTCYIKFELIVPLVKELQQKVRLTDVYLAFNYAEIYRDGPTSTKQRLDEITKELVKLGVEFDYKALASERLVHSKGYAVVQRSKDKIEKGVVLITSANFTTPGFDGENVEIGYVSTLKKDVHAFEEVFDKLREDIDRDIGTSVLKENNYLFKYALLSSGVFLHKWGGSLRQDVGIRYQLTEQAKEKGSIAPELARLGFEAGETFTRTVIDLQDMPEKEISASFIRRFTIETYWGRWCPVEAWEEYMGDYLDESESRKFIDAFHAAACDDKLMEYAEEARKTQEELIEKGLIKKVDDSHLDRWVDKVKELRESEKKLNRYYSGYVANHIPYMVEQKGDVEELYYNLLEAINLSKSKNIAKKMVQEAIDEFDLEWLSLDEEHEEIIDELRNGNESE